MRRSLVSAVLFTALSISSLPGDPLRIGSWNIENLHHREDFALRELGEGFLTQKRRASDFALLQKYRDLFGENGAPADVIALQEIGTVAALERIFPSSDYDTIMSPRWSKYDAPEGEGDVYTAIAVRRASQARVVSSAHLPELAVLDDEGIPTRAATGALIEYADEQFWFLSVHLKSSCPKVKKIHESIAEACRMLWAQSGILASWIEEKRATGIPVIIAGDFNRHFRQLKKNGLVWRALNGAGSDAATWEPWFEKHPLTLPRNCPTRKGESTQPFDWILVDSLLAGSVVAGSFWERRHSHDDISASRGGFGLSDHCPISLDIEVSG